MNKLLEIKDKAVKFCGEYEHFIIRDTGDRENIWIKR